MVKRADHAGLNVGQSVGRPEELEDAAELVRRLRGENYPNLVFHALPSGAGEADRRFHTSANSSGELKGVLIHKQSQCGGVAGLKPNWHAHECSCRTQVEQQTVLSIHPRPLRVEAGGARSQSFTRERHATSYVGRALAREV